MVIGISVDLLILEIILLAIIYFCCRQMKAPVQNPKVGIFEDLDN